MPNPVRVPTVWQSARMAGISTTHAGAVGTLTIDNPTRRNAMTADMYEAVPGAVADLLQDEDVRVVIVRGAGDKAFGAGSDITEFLSRRVGDQAEAYDRAEHAAWNAIASIPVPVIAAIHGPCIGGGVAMALHCDVRIAADDATFSLPPARLGLAYPHEALGRLVELVGPAMAKLLLYSARVIDAHEARAVGLVQEVVAKDEFDPHIEQLATHISHLAPLSHRATKVSIAAVSDDTHLPVAEDARRTCYASADFDEGVRAFLERRRPGFEGR
jgi:enoyl-CoA hydratase